MLARRNKKTWLYCFLKLFENSSRDCQKPKFSNGKTVALHMLHPATKSYIADIKQLNC